MFLEAHGVDTGAALQVLGGGLVCCTVLNRKGSGMLAANSSGLPLALHEKTWARQVRVAVPPTCL